MSFHILTSLTPKGAIIGAISLLILRLVYKSRTSRRALPYPPGPRPLPFIGNVLDMPQSKFAITWSRFGEEYGPLTWLTIPGQNILVINSFEAAKELLDKRASNSAERPRFTMANERLGLGNLLSINGYNEMWRKQRSHLKHALSAAVVRRDYSSLLETKAQQYLERCAARPENVLPETTRIIGEAIIQLSYGKLEDEKGRDYIQMSTRMMDVLAFAVQGHAVDLLPALRHLPSWLPGAKFKRDAARWKKSFTDLVDTMLELVKESRFSDDPGVRSSFVFKRIQELDDKHTKEDARQRHDDEIVVTYSSLSIYLGAIETVSILGLVEFL